RREELQVEVGPGLGVGQLEFTADPAVDVDDLNPHAGKCASDPVTVANKIHRSELLGFSKGLSTADDRLLGGHRHEKGIEAVGPLVAGAHRKAACAERRISRDVDGGHRYF